MSLIDSGSYYILIINRLHLVREHRLIRWCIFHTAVFFLFFFCNPIQRGDVLEYPLFIQNANNFDIYFFPHCAPAAKLRKMHAFDTNFSAHCATGPKVALLSTLLKASDVFSLFLVDGNILSWNWKADATALRCKSTGWVCLTLQILPLLPVYREEVEAARWSEQSLFFLSMKSLFALVMLTLLKAQSFTWPEG